MRRKARVSAFIIPRTDRDSLAGVEIEFVGVPIDDIVLGVGVEEHPPVGHISR